VRKRQAVERSSSIQDIAITKLRSVSFATLGITVDRLRFTSFAMGWRTQHTLIFLPCLHLHNVPDDFLERTRFEFPVSASFLIRKNLSSQVSIAANRLFHGHSKPAKHERYGLESDKYIDRWTITMTTTSHAGAANQIKVIAGKRGFFTALSNPDSLHDLFQI